MSKSQYIFEVRSLEPGAKILSNQGYEGCFSQIRWKQKITIADFFVDAICLKFSLNKDDFLSSELLLQVGTEAFPDIGFCYAERIELPAAEIVGFIKQLSILITAKSYSAYGDMFDQTTEFDCPELIKLISDFLRNNGDGTISSPLAVFFSGQKVVELAGRFAGRPCDQIVDGVFWLRGVEIMQISKDQRLLRVKANGISDGLNKISLSFDECQRRELGYAFGDDAILNLSYLEKLDAKGKRFYDLQDIERVGD